MGSSRVGCPSSVSDTVVRRFRIFLAIPHNISPPTDPGAFEMPEDTQVVAPIAQRLSPPGSYNITYGILLVSSVSSRKVSEHADVEGSITPTSALL